MPIALEIPLIAVPLTLAVGLVPLLFQLRRTVQTMDAFSTNPPQEYST